MIKSIEDRIKTDLGANYLIFVKRIKNLNLTACLIVRKESTYYLNMVFIFDDALRFFGQIFL